MLFQMCYGPEIPSIYEMIKENPRITIDELKEIFQYTTATDISSLIENTISFLMTIQFIEKKESGYLAICGDWDVIMFLKRLVEISKNEPTNSLNYVFTTLYYELFIKPNKLYIEDVHYSVNKHFNEIMVGKEKINAWKRIMEFFGLGYRMYTGFYALPHLSLLQQLVKRSGSFSGSLYQYCLDNIHPIIPCIHQGQIFDGLLMGLSFLNKEEIIHLERKQDLPYPSFGSKQQWNWITI
ncbi:MULTISPECIES: hypothetical protein [Laceyella]|uniref:Uncharacterized protein n=2 Tax=Laceyella TaxID=292635 RepID=A0AA45WRQ2_9BACL|nr:MULTISPECIES: hypothetical protein [Laceyella]UWE03385.1 hypothetical protein NYR52_14940 [Laceyella sacchari]SMP32046.1 hypothetical protein SAMN06265361_10885 [Laceyella tengchongensis]